MKRLFIYDFDGTIGDTRLTIVTTLQATLHHYGYDNLSNDTCAATIGLTLEDAFQRMINGLSRSKAIDMAAYYRIIFEDNKALLKPQPFPHVIDTIRAVHEQGIIQTIASSRGNQSLMDFVSDMHLTPYISMVVGANDVTNPKPHPEAVITTMNRMGISAEDTLVVGDMPFDIMMGANAHCDTCGVTYGNATRQQLADSGATFIIDDFQQLLDILFMKGHVRR